MAGMIFLRAKSPVTPQSIRDDGPAARDRPRSREFLLAGLPERHGIAERERVPKRVVAGNQDAGNRERNACFLAGAEQIGQVVAGLDLLAEASVHLDELSAEGAGLLGAGYLLFHTDEVDDDALVVSLGGLDCAGDGGVTGGVYCEAQVHQPHACHAQYQAAAPRTGDGYATRLADEAGQVGHEPFVDLRRCVSDLVPDERQVACNVICGATASSCRICCRIHDCPLRFGHLAENGRTGRLVVTPNRQARGRG